MSTSSASSRAPEHALPVLHSRRSFTLPARAASRPVQPPAPASTGSTDGIETLFICSKAKIVSFIAAASRRQSPSRSNKAEGGTSQSLAWSTPTERTLAVGVLRIYRVTASNVSFLNSGNLLHTIFPRSQCWCVDGQSIFVLRIRQDAYYRMELPYETEEDKNSIAQFTSVLSQVLQYERTQCPFTRAFQVEIQDRPKSPPRQKIRRIPSQQKVKKWTFDKTWVPEHGPELENRSRPSTACFEGSDCGTTSSYEEDDRSSICTDSSEVVPESSVAVSTSLLSRFPQRRPSVAERASMFQAFHSRSVTAQVRSEQGDSISSMARIPESPANENKSNEASKPILERQASDAVSMISSADSFYSLENATPPFLDAEADVVNPWAEDTPKQHHELRGRSSHRRQISEVTVRPTSVEYINTPAPVTPTLSFHPSTKSSGNLHASPAPSTPPLVSDSDDDSVPGLDVPTPPDAIRMKRLTGATQRRAFSPMPQAQNLFRPPKPSPSREFTSALVRKTCELVLGPPSHLVSIMLRIAASISNGFGFSTYRVRRTEKIPCSWESDEEAEWPEDDFGIPLGVVGDPVRRKTFSGELD